MHFNVIKAKLIWFDSIQVNKHWALPKINTLEKQSFHFKPATEMQHDKVYKRCKHINIKRSSRDHCLLCPTVLGAVKYSMDTEKGEAKVWQIYRVGPRSPKSGISVLRIMRINAASICSLTLQWQKYKIVGALGKFTAQLWRDRGRSGMVSVMTEKGCQGSMQERHPKERGRQPRPLPALNPEDIWELTNKSKGKGVPVRRSGVHPDRRRTKTWPVQATV